MIEDAHYVSDGLPKRYVGNPLIEALPAIRSPEEVARMLTCRPDIDIAACRMQPEHVRVHELDEIGSLYVPHPKIISLESDMGVMLRHTLMLKHPFLAETSRYLHNVRADIREKMKVQGVLEDPLAGTFLFTGIPGTGKTRGIRAVLGTYPQTIQHIEYLGRPFRQKQVVWLSVDAPVSGSIRGLLLRLFHALDRALGLTGDQRYFLQFCRSRMPYDIQIEHFAQAAATHFVGIIHIDDLQRIWEANCKQSSLIHAFIIQLANVVRIPLILSGTGKLTKLLAASLEVSRRSSSAGEDHFGLLENSDDKHFKLVMKALFKYQLVRTPLAWSTDVLTCMFDKSQGILGIAIKLYFNGQKIALRDPSGNFEIRHLEMAYQKMKVLHPILDVLRSKDYTKINHYEDLLSNDVHMARALKEKMADEMKA